MNILYVVHCCTLQIVYVVVQMHIVDISYWMICEAARVFTLRFMIVMGLENQTCEQTEAKTTKHESRAKNVKELLKQLAEAKAGAATKYMAQKFRPPELKAFLKS